VTARLPRTLVLVGMMGAGKSAIGRRLASRFGVEFVDADSEVERAAGCSITDIFELYGEQAFRDAERRVIARLLSGPVHVLSTGGGAFMDAETRETIAASGISLWLRADLELLVRRTARRKTRPLLNDGDPREILARLIEERHPVYALADIVIDSRDGPPEETADRAQTALERFLAGEASPDGAAPAPADGPTGETGPAGD